MTKVEALAKNASQTGQVLLGAQIGGQVITALGKPSTLIPVTSKLLILPWMLAKVYTNPRAIAFMTKALKVQPTSPVGISNFIKALTIAGINLKPSQKTENTRRPITDFEVER